MKVAIVGSRVHVDAIKVAIAVQRAVADLDASDTVISGGARGVDQWAEQAAKARGLHVVIHKPDWTLGRGAGMIRNAKIVADADMLLAFWDGQSKGTAHSIQLARKKGIPVQVVGTEAEQP